MANTIRLKRRLTDGTAPATLKSGECAVNEFDGILYYGAGNDGSDNATSIIIIGGVDLAGLDSPAFTGIPTAPTASSGTNTTQLATTAFVKTALDLGLQGLDPKQSVRVGTTGIITLSGEQTIDGVSVVDGDRILVKDQASAADNGIYIASSGAWSRSLDMDSWEEIPGAFTFTEEGSVNADVGWVCTSNQGGILGTTDITFVQFTGAAQIIAGSGLTKTGNTLNVETADSSRIVINADNIDLATTAVTPGTYQGVTIDSYGRATGATDQGYAVGAASSTDNAIARFDTTTGKLIQNSIVTIDDTGLADGLIVDGGTY